MVAFCKSRLPAPTYHTRHSKLVPGELGHLALVGEVPYPDGGHVAALSGRQVPSAGGERDARDRFARRVLYVRLVSVAGAEQHHRAPEMI